MVVFRRKKNNVRSQWEKQVTQARKQTKEQLNRMAERERHFEESEHDIAMTPTYDQSYGDPYYRHNEGGSVLSRSINNMDDGTNTYDGTAMNTYEGDGTITYDGMNTYEGDGTITYDGMNTYQGIAGNIHEGMNSYQGSWMNTYDGMNTYEGDGTNTYDGMNSFQGSARNAHDEMINYHSRGMDTYDGVNPYEGDGTNTYDGMNSFQGSSAKMLGGMNSYQGSGINTYDGIDSYQGSGINMYGGMNAFDGRTNSLQDGGMRTYQGNDGPIGYNDRTHENNNGLQRSQSHDGSNRGKGLNTEIQRKNSFRKGLKKIAKIGRKRGDKDDASSFMTLPTKDTYIDPDARGNEEEGGRKKGRGVNRGAAASNDGDTLTLMRRKHLKEEANRAASSSMIEDLLTNPILACVAAPIIPCLVCYTKCCVPTQGTVEQNAYRTRKTPHENKLPKVGRKSLVDMESVDNESIKQNNTDGGDSNGNNVSGTFEDRNIPGTFDNAHEIPISHSRSSRGDIESRASEFSRILSNHGISGDRSTGLNSRATDFSNIVSDGEKQPWKRKSSSFNSKKTEFSAVQSNVYGNKTKSSSFQSRKTEFSAIQSKHDRRSHTAGSLSKASTKASEFSRIDSKDDNTWRGSFAGRGGSKASNSVFSRIDSDYYNNDASKGGSYNESNQNSRPHSAGASTYGNSTNQSGSRHAPRTGNLWNSTNDSASRASVKSGNISKLTFDGTFGGVQSTSRPGSVGSSRMSNLWNSVYDSVTKPSGKKTPPKDYGNGSEASYGATGEWENQVNDTFSRAGDTNTYGSQFTNDNNTNDAESYAEDGYGDTGTVGGTMGTYDDQWDNDGGYSYRSETQATPEPPKDTRRRRKLPFKKMFRNKASE